MAHSVLVTTLAIRCLLYAVTELSTTMWIRMSNAKDHSNSTKSIPLQSPFKLTQYKSHPLIKITNAILALDKLQMSLYYHGFTIIIMLMFQYTYNLQEELIALWYIYQKLSIQQIQHVIKMVRSRHGITKEVIHLTVKQDLELLTSPI